MYEPFAPGTITREVIYVVVCALCGFEDNYPYHTREQAMKVFRKNGWSKTVKHGWICDNCKMSLDGE